MSAYQENKTQEQRILDLLRARGSHGAYVYEFTAPRNMGGLGVAQYNARLYGLRRKGYNIVNKSPGHFVLEEKTHEEKYQIYGQVEPKPYQSSLL